jgi:hypothetical protein
MAWMQPPGREQRRVPKVGSGNPVGDGAGGRPPGRGTSAGWRSPTSSPGSSARSASSCWPARPGSWSPGTAGLGRPGRGHGAPAGSRRRRPQATQGPGGGVEGRGDGGRGEAAPQGRHPGLHVHRRGRPGSPAGVRPAAAGRDVLLNGGLAVGKRVTTPSRTPDGRDSGLEIKWGGFEEWTSWEGSGQYNAPSLVTKFRPPTFARTFEGGSPC